MATALADISARDGFDEVAASTHTVGVVRIGPLMIALATAEIREVVPSPERLSAIPGQSRSLVGSLRLRGAIIPIVDLSERLGIEPRGAMRQIIVIARVAGALIGVRADSIVGVTTLSEGSLRPFDQRGDGAIGALFRGSFEFLDDVAYLAAAGDLTAIAGIAVTREHEGIDAIATKTREQMLVFAGGPFSFAIPARAVDTIIARPTLIAPPCSLPGWNGFIDRHGISVPVTDLRFALGIGELKPQDHIAAALVFKIAPRQYFAIAIDSVTSMTRATTGALAPMPALVSRKTQLFSGVRTDDAGKQQFFIDEERLRADESLVAIAVACASGDGAVKHASAQRFGAGTAEDNRPHIVFRAPQILAAPLTQIAQITHYPTHIRNLPDRDAWLIGEFVHRGESLPLVDLSLLMGYGCIAPDAGTRVLIVDCDRVHVGFAVSALISVVVGRRVLTGRPQDRAIPNAGCIVPPAMFVPRDEGHGVANHPILDFAALLAHHGLA